MTDKIDKDPFADAEMVDLQNRVLQRCDDIVTLQKKKKQQTISTLQDYTENLMDTYKGMINPVQDDFSVNTSSDSEYSDSEESLSEHESLEDEDTPQQ